MASSRPSKRFRGSGNSGSVVWNYFNLDESKGRVFVSGMQIRIMLQPKDERNARTPQTKARKH